ncbi:MAG: protein TorT [Oleispira sp.]|jgi:protein TorT
MFALYGPFVVAELKNPWSLEQRKPFNQAIQSINNIEYKQLISVKNSWRVCVLVPHLKDAYWMGINYGLVTHAKALNIQLELFEAGSYYAEDKQLNQLDYCLTQSFDGILLGAVSPGLLAKYQPPITKPIIALVNRLDSDKVSTRIGVNWYEMGYRAGLFVRQNEKEKSTLAILAGPNKQGGSDSVEQGIIDALEGSLVTVSAIQHADNNRNLYRDQLEILLLSQTPDYILGSAVAIEAAVSVLRQKELEGKIQLVSSYLSPAILRAIHRKKVQFSNDDLVVTQGQLAIDVMVRELEGASAFGDIGPLIQTQRMQAISTHYSETSLAPADYYPIYRVVPD